LPIPNPFLEVKQVTWVDFQFEGIAVSALGLLKKALSGVGSIETSIRPLL
jgi:hypothetical protein